jgi:glycosyltransferase involved in cell wall biosynthesis
MFPKAQATILGGGPHEDEFRSLNGQLGEPVTFGGYLPKDELSMYMSSSLVAVNAIVASSATSLPNKIFHYAACGLPIVNSVQGELADLLSCSNAGLQYEANNVASLVSSLTKIMLLDKSQYEAMARGARNMAEKYGDRALIEPAIISHVRRVLDERTSSL